MEPCSERHLIERLVDVDIYDVLLKYGVHPDLISACAGDLRMAYEARAVLLNRVRDRKEGAYYAPYLEEKAKQANKFSFGYEIKYRPPTDG